MLRKFFITAIPILLITFSMNVTYGQNKSYGEIKGLKSSDGKYPSEVKLKENKGLTARLKKLLGTRYSFMTAKWGPEIPIEIKENIFKSEFCEQHNCGSTNFIILFNFSTNTLCVGIREEGQVAIYMESNSCPSVIDEWKAKD
jgi:hypothetical protein